MARIELIAIESRHGQSSVPEWLDALSESVAQLPLTAWDQERTSCMPAAPHDFAGRIEFGALQDVLIAKVTTGSPHDITFSPGSSPTEPPIVLMFQTSGDCQVEQADSSCTLHPNDWCLIDTRSPFHVSSSSPHNENLSVRLERPSDPEVLALLTRGVGRRFQGATGVSRILEATVKETFNQMNTLHHVGGCGLARAIAGMAWQALREEVETTPRPGHDDAQRAHIKAVIESRLDDPDLSVEIIAHACGMSVRSVHRAFEREPGGSVSNYVWMRRLNRCAGELRNPGHAHRPITEVCFAWGFNSTSHFSRLFKERFGVTPREYRQASEHFGDPCAPEPRAH